MKLKLRAVFLLLMTVALLAKSAPLAAQADTSKQVYERGIVALDQALRDLSNPYTVMAVAASAGDIDYGTIAYYRKRLGAKTVITVATRDETGEKGAARRFQEETAVINTRRALAAANLVDSDLYFLNLPDSGHTKSAEEALSKWGQEAALGRLVKAIRLLRPDVIINTSDAKERDGQQMAVARLVVEAFDAAGDVSRFPEPDIEPWRVSRVFQRVAEESQQVIVSTAEYDASRGVTYEQMGLAALRQYRDRPAWPERLDAEEGKVFYKLSKSAPDDKFRPGTSLLDGLALPENLARSIAPPRVGDAPLTEAVGTKEKLVEVLRERLLEKRGEGTVQDIRGRYGSQFFRMLRYIEALERAIAHALDLSLEATLSDRVLVRGQPLRLKLSLRNGGSRPLSIVFHAPESLPVSDKKPAYKATEVTFAPAGAVTSEELQFQVPEDAALTLPHSDQIQKESFYAISSLPPGARNLEPAGARLVAYAEVDIDQTTIPLPALVSFDIAPPIEMSAIPFSLVKDWSKPRDFEFTVRMRNRSPGPFKGEFWVVPLALNSEDYKPQPVSFAKEDDEVSLKIKLKLPILKPPLSPEILMEVRREKPAPPTAVASLKVNVKSADFEVAEAIKVGYVSGFDSWMEFALNQLGVERTELQVADVKTAAHGVVETGAPATAQGCADLSGFNAIMIDNLAFMTRPDLIIASACLLKYVKRGGTLLVFYQQPDDWNYLLGQFAPFPIKLSKDRVTLENWPVKILEPEHTLLAKPNKITEKDFEGWALDRAIYVPGAWTADYTALLEIADPGEDPRRGSLLVARYGEGMFVYTSLDLRTQAIASNTGAYRLLANIVSLPATIKADANIKPPN
ncbi:MAG TPA: PIG-L family deacetylase [Blastocatellia bacterium]|nr:PIG-L family deacetylase [Blastocatellia bacterium]